MTALKPACLCLLALIGFAYPGFGDDEEQIEETYLAPETFLSESFDGDAPRPKALWLTSAIKQPIREILGHDYPAVRIRYWKRDDRTAWVLEEIGKTKPITVGILVENHKITRLKVLVYRESHGWEVKYPFFTDQFQEAQINEKLRLNKNIDGISGATLSVNALKKLGRLALYLHKQATARSSK